ISALEKQLKKDNIELKKQESELISNAKIKAREILLDAKEEANDIINNLNNMTSINGKETEKLRNKLNTKIKELSITHDTSEKKIFTSSSISIDQAKPGTDVFVKTFGKTGTIISNVSKKNDVQVQIGSLKTSVKLYNLELSDCSKKTTFSNNFHYTNINKTRNVTTEINVIGKNVEDAIFIVDKFLDDCYLAKLKTVRIIHGKGTGKLKSGIHSFLKTHPHVDTFRIGTFGEGEMGVTVVDLK
ncbi:MAG: Smr/MutS family protein, partial [Clostridia bacterium]|nr:Smr/MutS family protein [Clostridia bacterium]